MARDDEHSKLLAGLCYFSFVMVNLIFSIYVLITKKGGRYARFHAVQALCIFGLKMVLGMLFGFVFGIVIAGVMQMPPGSTAPSGLFAGFGILSIFILAYVAFFVVVFLLEILLTILVATGRDIRLPLISKIADKYAGK
ncbi:MAG: hypothetical protein V1822_02210 [Candidatus Micrarchaeota archaeon]